MAASVLIERISELKADKFLISYTSLLNAIVTTASLVIEANVALSSNGLLF
jgi:hypothetical protein